MSTVASVVNSRPTTVACAPITASAQICVPRDGGMQRVAQLRMRQLKLGALDWSINVVV